MDRRSFSVLTGVMALTVGLPLPATPAGADGVLWLDLFNKLEGFFDGLSDGIDWLTWSQDAIIAMRQGKVPPPSPEAPSTYHIRLKEQQTKISTLTLPTYNTPMPSSTAVPTQTYDTVRNELRSRISALDTALVEYNESTGAIKYFVILNRSLTSQEQRLRRLGEALNDLAFHVPIYLITQTLFFTALDVQMSYLPTVQETHELLDQKEREARTQFKARMSSLKHAAIELHKLLLIESVDLRSEVERLRSLDEEVAQLQELALNAAHLKTKALDEVNRQRANVQAADLDVQEASSQYNTALDEGRKIFNHISNNENEVKRQYICPVSGVDWDTCNAPEHQRYKDQYIRNKEHFQREIISLKQTLVAKEQLARDLSDVLHDTKLRLQQYNAVLQAAQQDLDAASERLSSAQKVMRDKAHIVLEQKWGSRADLFNTENINEQRILEKSIASMGSML